MCLSKENKVPRPPSLDIKHCMQLFKRFGNRTGTSVDERIVLWHYLS